MVLVVTRSALILGPFSFSEGHFRGAPRQGLRPYLDGGVDSDTLIEARPLATVGHRLVEAKICSGTGITCPRNSVLWDSLPWDSFS